MSGQGMNGIPVARVGVEASERHFDPVLQPDMQTLYRGRANRWRALSEGHELKDYLLLAAAVADAQAGVIAQPRTVQAQPVPDPVRVAREGQWCRNLDAILESVAKAAPPQLAPHLDELRSLSDPARLDAGLALAEGRFEAVAPALAPFLWAALSLEVALAARAHPLPQGGNETADCPVCGTAPVASFIYAGDRQGFRYLHCALCESQWHMVRAKCTNCGDAGQLDYLSFDTTEAAVRAESCGHCSGYLKVISQERDPGADVVADDLATLVLDEAATAEGYRRTGFNPFALPQGNG